MRPVHAQIIRDAPGHSPIRRKALEPTTPMADDAGRPGLRDMSRRLGVAVALKMRLLVLAMRPRFSPGTRVGHHPSSRAASVRQVRCSYTLDQ